MFFCLFCLSILEERSFSKKLFLFFAQYIDNLLLFLFLIQFREILPIFRGFKMSQFSLKRRFVQIEVATEYVSRCIEIVKKMRILDTFREVDGLQFQLENVLRFYHEVTLEQYEDFWKTFSEAEDYMLRMQIRELNVLLYPVKLFVKQQDYEREKDDYLNMEDVLVKVHENFSL